MKPGLKAGAKALSTYLFFFACIRFFAFHIDHLLDFSNENIEAPILEELPVAELCVPVSLRILGANDFCLAVSFVLWLSRFSVYISCFLLTD